MIYIYNIIYRAHCLSFDCIYTYIYYIYVILYIIYIMYILYIYYIYIYIYIYVYTCRVNLRIPSECGKIRTRKTPNTNTFHAVIYLVNVKKSTVISKFVHIY